MGLATYSVLQNVCHYFHIYTVVFKTQAVNKVCLISMSKKQNDKQ